MQSSHMGLPECQPPLTPDDDTGRLPNRHVSLSQGPVQSPFESGADRRRHSGFHAVGDEHDVSDLLRWRPVRAFPIGTGDRRARHTALPAIRQSASIRACCRRQPSLRVRDGGGLGRSHRMGPRRVAGNPNFAGTKINNRTGRHGHFRATGGLPSLTAALVIATGILGAALGPYVLNILRIKNWAARGLALGTASHGIGTARAVQVNEVAGAFSGLAMGLNALATAVLLPIVWRWLF